MKKVLILVIMECCWFKISNVDPSEGSWVLILVIMECCWFLKPHSWSLGKSVLILVIMECCWFRTGYQTWQKVVQS